MLQQGLDEDVQIFFGGLFSELLLRRRRREGRRKERSSEATKQLAGRGKKKKGPETAGLIPFGEKDPSRTSDAAGENDIVINQIITRKNGRST